MSGDLLVGAVASLAGVVIGGVFSLMLSRQQMKGARVQRGEEFSREKEREKERRSADRRFDAYADFSTKGRSFRNAIRHYGDNSHPDFTPAAVDSIARSVHDASALVFLVVESEKTYDLCAAIVETVGRAQGCLPHFGPDSKDDPWLELNKEMGRLLREFQAEAREELEIGGVDRSHIVNGATKSNTHSTPSS